MKPEGTVAEVLAGAAKCCVAHARCEDFARSIPDGSVNLHWIDPPYFRVVDEDWDRAWKSEADYLAWLRGVIAEAARTLAPNGSLYLFASAEMAARVEVTVGSTARVLNSIVWVKSDSANRRGRSKFRRFACETERVVFAEKRSGAVSFAGDAIRAARTAAGLSQADLDVRLGFIRSRDAARGTGIVRQWETDDPGSCVPSCSDFARALRACGDGRGEASIALEYERLVRPFNEPEALTDVWTYASAASAVERHPCEKPAAMLRDVVRASSRPGDVVCEWFGGSFRMAEAALAEGRRYIGCDADAHWYGVGVERARAAVNGTVAAVAARRAKAPADARQTSLFDSLTKAGAT